MPAGCAEKKIVAAAEAAHTLTGNSNKKRTEKKRHEILEKHATTLALHKLTAKQK